MNPAKIAGWVVMAGLLAWGATALIRHGRSVAMARAAANVPEYNTNRMKDFQKPEADQLKK
jgi:hypothetical protein